MIWITTICLLLVFAWLLFNGLNERRWVKAHSHDESVSSDEGLLYNLSSRTNSGTTGGGTSGGDEQSLFGRTVARVSESSAKFDQRLREKINTASNDSASGDDANAGNFVARTTRKVAQRSDDLGKLVAERAKSMTSDEGVFGNMSGKVSSGVTRARAGAKKAAADGEDLMTRISKKVGAKVNEFDDKVIKSAKKSSQND
jgi:hypothetical protein